jgi:hypothetical protein
MGLPIDVIYIFMCVLFYMPIWVLMKIALLYYRYRSFFWRSSSLGICLLIDNSLVDDLLGLTYATISTLLHINCDIFSLNLFLLVYWMLLMYYHSVDKVFTRYL